MSGHFTAATCLCSKCGNAPGTERWVGEGGAIALIHGDYSWWCKRCVLEAQIEHAEKQASRLPELRAALDAFTGGCAASEGVS